jgi:hypothetical protein
VPHTKKGIAMSTENTSIDESSSGIDSSIQDPIENNFSMSAAGRTKKPAVDVVEAYSDEMDEDDEQEVAAPAENAFETWNLSKEVLKSLA